MDKNIEKWSTLKEVQEYLEVDEWIRSGGASDENNTEDKEQA